MLGWPAILGISFLLSLALHLLLGKNQVKWRKVLRYVREKPNESLL
jgi:hypothetical protein